MIFTNYKIVHSQTWQGCYSNNILKFKDKITVNNTPIIIFEQNDMYALIDEKLIAV